MKNRLMDVHDKIYRKGADFSRKRYGRFLQKERTFTQKGTDFLPKRNAPFRRKIGRNKKIKGVLHPYFYLLYNTILFSL